MKNIFSRKTTFTFTVHSSTNTVKTFLATFQILTHFTLQFRRTATLPPSPSLVVSKTIVPNFEKIYIPPCPMSHTHISPSLLPRTSQRRDYEGNTSSSSFRFSSLILSRQLTYINPHWSVITVYSPHEARTKGNVVFSRTILAARSVAHFVIKRRIAKKQGEVVRLVTLVGAL